jgi:NAD-dependent SIR2 family protein deacetylase
MSVGDVHRFKDGYAFVETLHGPLMEGRCNDCGAMIYVAAPVLNKEGQLVPGFSSPNPRCSTCGRRHHGLAAY